MNAREGRQLNDLQGNPLCGGLLRRVTGGVLVDGSEFVRLPSHLLHRCDDLSDHLGDLGQIVLFDWDDMQCEQMAEHINGEVDLAAVAPFRSIPAHPMTALRRALHSPVFENHDAELNRAALPDRDPFAQVDDDGGDDIGKQPAAGLLIDRRPGRQVVGHEVPLQSGAGNDTEPVEALE